MAYTRWSQGLVNKVKGYITAATKEDGSDYSVTMCHDSNSISPLTSSHMHMQPEMRTALSPTDM